MVYRLIVALLAVAAAVPVRPSSIVDLTQADFQATTAEDTWFVKFYSPFCGHCKEFAPKWDSVYEQIGAEVGDKQFYFANVDCTIDGDLCDTEDIGAYPTLRIYQQGVATVNYISPDREPERVIEFVREVMDGKQFVTDKRVSVMEPEAKEESGTSAVESSAAVIESVTPATAVESAATSTALAQFPPFGSNTLDVNSIYPAQPKATAMPLAASLPNRDGTSQVLDSASFNKNVSGSVEPWIIKFYSPRCPHCVAMKPAWDAMAKSMQGKIRIGEVNCDMYGEVCRDNAVNAYPTISYLRGASRIEYNGLRGLGDLVAFAEGAAYATNIQDITKDQMLDLLDNGGRWGPSAAKTTSSSVTHPSADYAFPLYVYVYDEATAAEDREALDEVAVRTLGRGQIVQTSDPAVVTFLKARRLPALYVVHSRNWFERYEEPTPKGMRDVDAMSIWVRQQWMDQVPQLTPDTAQDIMSNAQIVVMALVDPRNVETHARAVREMRAAAAEARAADKKRVLAELTEARAKKQLRIDEAADRGDADAKEREQDRPVQLHRAPVVGFTWVDSVFWERWLRKRFGHDPDTSEPRIIIVDERGARFWGADSAGGLLPVSRVRVAEAIEAVVVRNGNGLQQQAIHDSVRGLGVWALQSVGGVRGLMLLGLALTLIYVYRRRLARPAFVLPVTSPKSGMHKAD